MPLQGMLSLEETWGQTEGRLTPSVAPGALLEGREVVVGLIDLSKTGMANISFIFFLFFTFWDQI